MMNVQPLLEERERLTGILAEAKSARAKLNQINRLIAMYGDQAKAYKHAKSVPTIHGVKCPDCGKVFAGPHGVVMHRVKAHNYRRSA